MADNQHLVVMFRSAVVYYSADHPKTLAMQQELEEARERTAKFRPKPLQAKNLKERIKKVNRQLEAQTTAANEADEAKEAAVKKAKKEWEALTALSKKKAELEAELEQLESSDVPAKSDEGTERDQQELHSQIAEAAAKEGLPAESVQKLIQIFDPLKKPKCRGNAPGAGSGSGKSGDAAKPAPVAAKPEAALESPLPETQGSKVQEEQTEMDVDGMANDVDLVFAKLKTGELGGDEAQSALKDAIAKRAAPGPDAQTGIDASSRPAGPPQSTDKKAHIFVCTRGLQNGFPSLQWQGAKRWPNALNEEERARAADIAELDGLYKWWVQMFAKEVKKITGSEAEVEDRWGLAPKIIRVPLLTTKKKGVEPTVSLTGRLAKTQMLVTELANRLALGDTRIFLKKASHFPSAPSVKTAMSEIAHRFPNLAGEIEADDVKMLSAIRQLASAASAVKAAQLKIAAIVAATNDGGVSGPAASGETVARQAEVLRIVARATAKKAEATRQFEKGISAKAWDRWKFTDLSGPAAAAFRFSKILVG